MRFTQVTERYARSLFELALERKELEPVRKDVLLVQKVCRENRDFRLFLKSPVIRTDKKEKIVKELFPGFNPITLNFMLIVIRKNREELIPGIADQFIEQYKEHHHILTVRLTAAAPVTDDVRKRVEGIMKEYTENKIELVEVTDPGVIGGFLLSWRDLQYDATVRRQVEKLKKGVGMINLYVKDF